MNLVKAKIIPAQIYRAEGSMPPSPGSRLYQPLGPLAEPTHLAPLARIPIGRQRISRLILAVFALLLSSAWLTVQWPFDSYFQ